MDSKVLRTWVREHSVLDSPVSRWHGFGYSGEVAGIQPAKSRGRTGPDEDYKGFGGDGPPINENLLISL